MGYKEKEYTTCRRCGGMGKLSRTCPTCRGAKKVNDSWCPTCQGVGELQERCPDCRGQGVVPRFSG